MKKIAFAAALLCAAAPAAATDWYDVAIDADGTGKWSMDLDTYSSRGSVAAFYGRHQTNTGEYLTMLVAVDCNAMMFRVGDVRTYNRNGYLTNHDSGFDNWRYIGAQSIADFYVSNVCQ